MTSKSQGVLIILIGIVTGIIAIIQGLSAFDLYVLSWLGLAVVELIVGSYLMGQSETTVKKTARKAES
jgi:hypothetical protein